MLFKILVDGGASVRLVTGPAQDPVWSPDGTLIAYAGATVGPYAPLLATRPDGTPVELAAIEMLVGGARARFLPGGKSVVFMQGLGASQDFWILDLETMKTRQLAHLTNSAAMRTFDITPDGKQIVFDRRIDASRLEGRSHWAVATARHDAFMVLARTVSRHVQCTHEAIYRCSSANPLLPPSRRSGGR